MPDPSETVEPKSAWWLAFRVFDEPGAVFRQLASKPTYLLPIVLLIVTSAIAAFGTPESVLREQAERQADMMEQRAPDRMTETDRMELLENAASPKRRLLLLFGVGSAVGVVVLFFVAGVLKLIFASFGAEPLKFKDELAIVAHAWMPLLAGGVLMVLLWRLAGFQGDLSLKFLVPGEGFLHNLAAGINLFGVWTVGLLALGNQIRTGAKKIGAPLAIVGGLYLVVKLVAAGATTLATGIGG